MAPSAAGAPRRTTNLSQKECLRLLATKDLGRLAIAVDGQPLIFPVNYVMEDRVVVFRTGPGLKLERGPYTRVAFEVDDVDRRTGVAWSVMVQGTAQDISESIDARSTRLRKLAVHPVAPGSKSRWMGVYAERITGRRFRLGQAA